MSNNSPDNVVSAAYSTLSSPTVAGGTAISAGAAATFVHGASLLEAGQVYHLQVDLEDPTADKVRGWLLSELDAASTPTVTEGNGKLVYSGDVIELVPAAGRRKVSFVLHTTAGTVPNPTDRACRVYINKIS